MRKFNDDQIRVLEDSSQRLLVSASAGSGKTTVMIQKITELVRGGASLKNMLISTFTKASSSDMRSKMYDALFLERDNPHIREELDNLASADITTLHGFCQRQITQYFYILGIDPDFSVLDESTANNMQNECLDKVIEEEIQKGDTDFILLYDILLSYRRDFTIRGYIKDIYKFATMQANPSQWLTRHKQPPTFEQLKEETQNILDQKRQRLIARATELHNITVAAGFTRNIKFTDQLIDFLRGYVDELAKPSGKIEDHFKPLNEAFTVIKGEAKDFMEEVGLRLEELAVYKQNPLENVQNADVLARMAQRLGELYSSIKQEKAALDFSDLEHYMLRLLEDEKASAEITERYRHIFVDEYQDISPLQETILSKLSKKAKMFYVGDIKQSIYAFRGCEPSIFLEKYNAYKSDNKNENEQKNSQNSPKSDQNNQNSEKSNQQNHVQNDDQNTGRVISLNQNYRSDERILELSNHLFGEVMTKDFGGLDYKNDGKFIAAKGEIGLPPQLILVRETCEKKPDLPPIYSVKQHLDLDSGSLVSAEQDMIVRKVLDLILEETEHDGQKKAIDLSDIVVLVRTGGDYVRTLKAKLERASLPVSMGEKMNFLSESITEVLIKYLELINNHSNDIALISVMHSIFGGFTLDELTQIRAFDNNSEYFHQAVQKFIAENNISNETTNKNAINTTNSTTTPNNTTPYDTTPNNATPNNTTPNNTTSNNTTSYDTTPNNTTTSVSTVDNAHLAKKLEDFYSKLEYYYKLSVEMPVDRLLGVIVADADYFKYAFSAPEGKSKAMLLDSFLNFASDCPYNKSITSFLFHLFQGVNFEVAPQKSGAVRIMTIHASKGLEFPFVLLANTAKRFNVSDANQSLILDKNYGICLKFWDEESHTVQSSSVWWAARECLKRTMLEEELRVLYVALTRAERGLFVFGTLDQSSKNIKLLECGRRLVDYTKVSNSLIWLLTLPKDYHKIYTADQARLDLEQDEEISEMPLFNDINEHLAQKIKQKIDFVYPYKQAIRKTFVTAAAKLDNENDDTTPVLFSEKDDDTTSILFSKEDEVVGEKSPTSGDRLTSEQAIKLGNAYHKALELIDFKEDFEKSYAKLDEEIISLINCDTLKRAVKRMSELAQNREAYKELPFILNCPLCEIIEGESGEKVLIQGVIDLLLLGTSDAIIIDYKNTSVDRLSSKEYTKQIKIYAKAVRDILNLEVKKAYLYSIKFDALLEVNIS